MPHQKTITEVLTIQRVNHPGWGAALGVAPEVDK